MLRREGGKGCIGTLIRCKPKLNLPKWERLGVFQKRVNCRRLLQAFDADMFAPAEIMNNRLKGDIQLS